MKPLLSIVIANYNYGRFLSAAVRSVVDQSGFDKCELIIVDGGSTDNSVDIIKKYQDKISWWCSEKDSGQSDAFNKGISHSHGKYLTWLNADDLFVPGCIKKICDQLVAHPECEWFTGNFYRFNNETGKVVEVGWGPHWYPRFLQRRNSPLVIFGPTTFFSRKIFDCFGPFDIRLRYTMDTDMWLRFIKGGVKQRRLNFFCWMFRLHEASKTGEFGEHKVSAGALEIGRRESLIRQENSQCKASLYMRWMLLALRFFDGSFISRFCYQCRLVGRSAQAN